MGSNTSGGDDNVVAFPKTTAERAALQKAHQDLARQKLVNLFVAGKDALFSSGDGVAFADLIIAGHRETWPIKSRHFRHELVRYLKGQFEELTGADIPLAQTMGAALKKQAVNDAIDEFEMQAICSRSTRQVHLRVAADGDDLYIDLADADWHAVRVTAAGWSIVQSPPVRFRRSDGMHPLPFPTRGMLIDQLRAETARLDQPLRAVMTSLAERLEWTEPEFVDIAPMRLDMIADRRRHNDAALRTILTKGVVEQLVVPDPSPPGRRVPAVALLRSWLKAHGETTSARS